MALFGAPEGIELAEAGRRAREMHDLSLAKGEVELRSANIDLNNQQRMQEMMSQMGKQQSGPMQTDDLADKMDSLASIAMSAGLPEKAKEYANTGSTLRKNAAELATTKLNTDLKEMNLMSSLLEEANDPQSWARANALFEMQTGKPSPWAKVPFNPQMVDKIRQGVTSAKDRALTRAALAREKAAEAEIKEREARIPLIQQQTKVAAAREKALLKAGSTGSIPKASDLKAITDLMFQDYGGQLPEDARVLARPIAEEALSIRSRENVTPSQAAVRAYQNAKARGDLTGIQPRRPEKGTAKTPLELPSDPKRLKANMFYNKGGKTYLFTGAAFVPVGAGPGMIQDEGEVDSDDELPAEEAVDEED